jgi:hypothetical protein
MFFFEIFKNSIFLNLDRFTIEWCKSPTGPYFDFEEIQDFPIL